MIGAVPERGWRPLPEYALSEVAEGCYQPTGWGHSYRYVVKRELAEKANGELDWKYHVVVTNDEQRRAAEVLV